jgi:arylsulfatase B/arylsulfatase I/J
MNYVKKLTEQWADAVLPAQKPEEGDKKTLWASTNASVPWQTTDFEPPHIVQKYSYDKAPNIVFALVDDWGYNDVGFRSTYMSWTTPTIDKLASQGVILENYWTMYSCIPARGAFLTGRFPLRLGVWQSGEGAELPLGEITLAQEMKSAGYKTYMVGKWHLGYSTWQHTPTERGFDSFYGYYNGHIDYWSKKYGHFLDLHDNKKVVTDKEELDENLHTGHLFQSKVEDVIAKHAANHADEPMFIYYAMQLIHGVWSAPQNYLDRCGVPATAELDDYYDSVEYNYCGLNVMLDEAIANLTCALEKNNMADNTYLFIVSDNGGEKMNPGNSYPWRGQKGAYYKGGMFGTAIIHSKLLPPSSWGTKYNGLVHVTGTVHFTSILSSPL